jgi:hypothetical protein
VSSYHGVYSFVFDLFDMKKRRDFTFQSDFLSRFLCAKNDTEVFHAIITSGLYFACVLTLIDHVY